MEGSHEQVSDQVGLVGLAARKVREAFRVPAPEGKSMAEEVILRGWMFPLAAESNMLGTVWGSPSAGDIPVEVRRAEPGDEGVKYLGAGLGGSDLLGTVLQGPYPGGEPTAAVVVIVTGPPVPRTKLCPACEARTRIFPCGTCAGKGRVVVQ